MFKPFFIHRFWGPGYMPNRCPRGFTFKVGPDPENPRNIIVQGAWCSPKDQFNKSLGRKYAEESSPESLNKRELPKLVHRAHVVCELESTQDDHNYLLKYVV